jgi:hypothetical protein
LLIKSGFQKKSSFLASVREGVVPGAHEGEIPRGVEFDQKSLEAGGGVVEEGVHLRVTPRTSPGCQFGIKSLITHLFFGPASVKAVLFRLEENKP